MKDPPVRVRKIVLTDQNRRLRELEPQGYNKVDDSKKTETIDKVRVGISVETTIDPDKVTSNAEGLVMCKTRLFLPFSSLRQRRLGD